MERYVGGDIMNFLINTPPYTHVSAGPRVLHYMCHLINQTEHTCYVSTEGINPIWKEYIWNNEKIDITIYPEIIDKVLDIGCKHVRWCLNVPGGLGGPPTYTDKEMIWYYCDALKSATQKATFHMVPQELCLPTVDKSIFDNVNVSERNLDGCYYIGKGYNNIPLPSDITLLYINKIWPTPKEELVKLFKKSKRFYCYDGFTIMLKEALYCGCEVFLSSKNGWIPYTDNNYTTTFMDLETDLEKINEFIKQVKEYFKYE